MPRLVFLLGEDAEGPAALFRDLEFGARQEAFRARLPDSGVTTATVTHPGELETALLHALVELPRPSARAGASGQRPMWSVPARAREFTSTTGTRSLQIRIGTPMWASVALLA